MPPRTEAEEAQLAQTADLLKRAKKLVYKEPDTAIELLQKALEVHDKMGLSDDPRNADFYLNYGLALVRRYICERFGERGVILNSISSTMHSMTLTDT